MSQTEQNILKALIFNNKITKRKGRQRAKGEEYETFYINKTTDKIYKDSKRI